MAYEPWQPGMRITALRLASISPTWQDWTPAWTTNTGANSPSLGNGTTACSYCQSGNIVFYHFEVVFGTTTSFGGGGTGDNWRFSAPVPAATTQIICGYGEIQRGNTDAIGGSGLFSNTAGTRMGVRMRLTTASTFEVEMASGNISGVDIDAAAGLIDASTPAWGATAPDPDWTPGSYIRAFGFYRSA